MSKLALGAVSAALVVISLATLVVSYEAIAAVFGWPFITDVLRPRPVFACVVVGVVCLLAGLAADYLRGT